MLPEVLLVVVSHGGVFRGARTGSEGKRAGKICRSLPLLHREEMGVDVTDDDNDDDKNGDDDDEEEDAAAASAVDGATDTEEVRVSAAEATVMAVASEDEARVPGTVTDGGIGWRDVPTTVSCC